MPCMMRVGTDKKKDEANAGSRGRHGLAIPDLCKGKDNALSQVKTPVYAKQKERLCMHHYTMSFTHY